MLEFRREYPISDGGKGSHDNILRLLRHCPLDKKTVERDN